jgi:hypothetical protein
LVEPARNAAQNTWDNTNAAVANAGKFMRANPAEIPIQRQPLFPLECISVFCARILRLRFRSQS